MRKRGIMSNVVDFAEHYLQGDRGVFTVQAIICDPVSFKKFIADDRFDTSKAVGTIFGIEVYVDETMSSNSMRLAYKKDNTNDQASV